MHWASLGGPTPTLPRRGAPHLPFEKLLFTIVGPLQGLRVVNVSPVISSKIELIHARAPLAAARFDFASLGISAATLFAANPA